MKELNSCTESIESCLASKTFAIAHLYKEEKAMDMHIHDCLEIYYSISGGKQFLIDNKFYDIERGDLFAINQFESHKLTQIDKSIHERIVISVHPDYPKKLSSEATNLNGIFERNSEESMHRIRLNEKQQAKFLYYVDKIRTSSGFGADKADEATFTELLIMLNAIAVEEKKNDTDNVGDVSKVREMLDFINDNLQNQISISDLSKEFYLSESYICRIFKIYTGTTVHKYVTARRITIAKALLLEGASVTEVFERSGFSDYSVFFKAFSKAVGMSPKQYSSSGR